MLLQIIIHTPIWVFALLLALAAFGLKQALPRRVTYRSVVLFPVALVGLSFYGAASSFGASLTPMVAWVAAAVCTFALVLATPLPQGAVYHQGNRFFDVPGSWLPMVLMMGIFVTKYLVGATTAMNPSMAHDATFMLTFGTIYGVFAGAFLGRAARLVKLAHRTQPAHDQLAISRQ